MPRVPDKVLDAAKLDPAASVQLGTARQELEQSRADVTRASDAIVHARQEEKLAERLPIRSIGPALRVGDPLCELATLELLTGLRAHLLNGHEFPVLELPP